MQSQYSQKELVLQAIREMNNSLLEVMQEELQMQRGVKADLMVAELSAAFEEFREGGDDYLNMKAGKCRSINCEHQDKCGFVFLGEQSRKCIGVIFDEEPDRYIGACSCRFLHAGDEQEHRFTVVDLNALYSYKGSLVPTEFLSLSDQCLEALATFRALAVNDIADYDICISWLNDYKDLYRSFKLPPIFDVDQRKFHSAYSWVSELVSYETRAEETIRALADFPKTSNQEDILNWCRQYESLGQSLLLFGWTSEDYLKVDEVTLLLPGLADVARFKELFDEYYWSLNLNDIG